MPKTAHVYILASHKHGTLYVGVTSDLERRLHQHRQHLAPGFTSKYDVSRLVWYTQGEDIRAAIALEKKIKNRSRQWKVDLIEKSNPGWDDLSAARLEGPCRSCEFDDAGRADVDNRRMATPTFRIADPAADRDDLVALNVEHVTWVFSELQQRTGVTARQALGAEVADYVPTIIDKVCGDTPPDGLFYLVEVDGALVAMGGLRRSGDGVAELKRVFVRPAGRGRGLGAAITRRLIEDARRFGYRSVRLDTMPFMHAAQALYESLGFVDCAPYPIEMPESFRDGIRYMQLTL